MSDLMDLTLWTLWEWSYESIESVPIEVTWLNPMRMSLSKWMESMRFEWIEVNRTIRGEMSDLKDLTWNPFKVTWVNSVGISLWVENECPYQSDLSESDLIKPYQNEWNRWEMNELRWIEVKWVIWRIWLCEPYGNGPMVRRRCPYQSDLNEPYEKVPIKMNGIDEKWMNWSE